MKLKVDQLKLIAVIVEEINRQHGGTLIADSRVFDEAIGVAKYLQAKLDGMEVKQASDLREEV